MQSILKATFLAIIALGPQISLYSVSHYYDAVGRLIQVAYPQGSGINYVYDDNDNLLSTTTITIPTPPQNLVTTTHEDSGVSLSWEGTEGATDYRIYRRRGTNLAWVELITVPAGTILFVDTETAPQTEYVYRIVAEGELGLSAYSEPSSAVSAELFIFSASLLQSATGEELYEIMFPAKQSSTYRLEFSNTLQNDAWSLQAYRLSPGGSDSQDLISGVDGQATLYLVVEETALPRFFRVIKDPE